MSFDPTHENYISQVKLPGSDTIYWVKDSEARDWIEQLASAGIKFRVAWDGTSIPDVTKIPAGVTVTYQGTEYTGTLVASETTAPYILLVYKKTTATGRTIYEEFITVTEGTGESGDPFVYWWELLGDTDISLEDLGDLAFYDSVILTPTKDSVLGADTTFALSSGSVTISGGSSDTFVKSYPGSTNKLATTSIKGVGTDVTFNAVGTATDYDATETVFGTDTTASKVTTTSKTATNLVLGTATTASKATAGTAVSLAKPASSATNISRIGLSSGNTSILETATVTNECLTFGSASVTQGSVTGINGSESITPYSFTNVDVPVITSNDSVTFNAVGSNTDVTVPVVTSNVKRTMTKITTASTTAATSASNATVVATGKVSATDPNGDAVLIGLGTATTASAVTGVGTASVGTAITVGTNDLVNAVTDEAVSYN